MSKKRYDLYAPKRFSCSDRRTAGLRRLKLSRKVIQWEKK
jgi:hypothetical protein